MTEKIAPEYYDVTLGKVLDFGNDTRDFELLFKPGKVMRFIAGQFVSVVLPKDGKMIRRAYSVASPPEQTGSLNLVIKRVEDGVVTRWFWGLRGGDCFRIHGPFGKFILPRPVDFEPLFVATGTGVAPFRSMIHSLLRSGHTGRMALIFGTRYDTMIPYHAEWLDLAQKHPNFSYIPTISRPTPAWKGESGYAQAQIAKRFADPAGKRVYICGLNEMIQATQEACLKAGFSKEQISCEKYD